MSFCGVIYEWEGVCLGEELRGSWSQAPFNQHFGTAWYLTALEMLQLLGSRRHLDMLKSPEKWFAWPERVSRGWAIALWKNWYLLQSSFVLCKLFKVSRGRLCYSTHGRVSGSVAFPLQWQFSRNIQLPGICRPIYSHIPQHVIKVILHHRAFLFTPVQSCRKPVSRVLVVRRNLDMCKDHLLHQKGCPDCANALWKNCKLLQSSFMLFKVWKSSAFPLQWQFPTWGYSDTWRKQDIFIAIVYSRSSGSSFTIDHLSSH